MEEDRLRWMMKLGVLLEVGEVEDGERLKFCCWLVVGGGVNVVDCLRECCVKFDVCSYFGVMVLVILYDCIIF